MKTPVVLTVRSVDSGVGYNIQPDGTAALSYVFPESLDLQEPHAVKLLYLKGPEKHVFCTASFIEPQGFNRDPLGILGSSITGSNVYIPLSTNFLSSVGWFILSNIDGTPIDKLEATILALHFIPLKAVKY